jgi:hypothetical protein
MDIHGLRGGRLRRHRDGYCVEGPGFYVWDEDPREVSRIARDLTRGVAAPLPALPAVPDRSEGGSGEA